MITKEMKINTIIKQHPEVIHVFYDFGLQGCFGCLQAKFETLEQASVLHQFDLEQMLDALNESSNN